MRRLLAILLAAGSFAAGAQTPTEGQILFDLSATPVVNKTACEAGAAETIGLTWNATLDTDAGTLTDGEFRIYATATQPSGNYCTVAAADANLIGVVDAPTSDTISTPVDVTMAQLLTAAAYDCVSGNKTIYVCVHFLNASAVDKGYAKGTISLKVAAPNAPTVTKVAVGEEALNVEIDPAATGETAISFVAKAVAADPTIVGEHRSSSTAVNGRARIGGLVNGRDYLVTAFTYTAEGNESPESLKYGTQPDGTPVAPQPIMDAWEHYAGVGGRDSGGCQAGGAGLAALACAAVLLRLRSRS